MTAKRYFHARRKSSPEPEKPLEVDHARNLAIISFFAIVLYLPSIDGAFVFDDAETILNNPVVTGALPIKDVWKLDFWGRDIFSNNSHKSFRPITTLTFRLNYLLNGISPFGYHTVNIILHCLVTILTYKATLDVNETFEISSSSGNIAFLTASLFSVHPIHTEAVANVTGRSELLMTFFSLAAIITFLRADHSKLSNFLYPVLIFFSTFCKEQGIMTVPICFLLEVLSSHRKSIQRKIQLIIYMISILLIRMYFNGFSSAKFTALDNAAAFLEVRHFRVINYVYLWFYHAFLLAFPFQLCFDYSMGCISTITSWTDFRAATTFILCLSPFLIYRVLSNLSKEHRRLFLFGLSSGALSFLPCTNIFFTVGFTVAERVLYLPSFGFCLLVAIGYQRTKRHIKNLDFIVLGVLILAASKTFTRSEQWRSEYSLYRSGIDVCPKNAKIHYNLGKVLGDLGNVRDAERNYWRAIRLNPSYEQALNNLGNLLDKIGERETAENLLLRAVKTRPNFAAAWMNLAITQMNLFKYLEAEISFMTSLRLRPDSPHCYFNLGVLYQKTDRNQLAKAAWYNATRLDPYYEKSWINLFVVLYDLGECEELIQLSAEALSKVPNESGIHMQLGTCIAHLGDYGRAETFIKTAILMNPTVALYRANLGVLYQRNERYSESAKEYEAALKLDPNCITAASNLHAVQSILSKNRTRTNYNL